MKNYFNLLKVIIQLKCKENMNFKDFLLYPLLLLDYVNIIDLLSSYVKFDLNIKNLPWIQAGSDVARMLILQVNSAAI